MTASPAAPMLITAASALTAVGEGAPQTCASIRAGLRRIQAHPSYLALPKDPELDDDEPLGVVPAPGLDSDLPGRERLLALLQPVLADLARTSGLLRTHLRSCAVLLALPEASEPTASWGLGEDLAAEVLGRLGLAPPALRVSRAGHTGMLSLLGEATALLQSGAAARCIVAGVDSYLDTARLGWLDERYRLKSPRGVDGFFPGEGASALLVETAAEAKRRDADLAASVAVRAVATGTEPRTVLGPDPSSGRGLTEALRGALGPEPPRLVACDLNGESYRSFEWGLVLARLGDRLAHIERLVLPAASTGDLGAATGGLLAAAAIEAFRRGYGPPGDAIVWASSTGGERAAARLARAP